ncbi:1-aminocyclopropane-1-carboxylate deaminase/D-cysteine desulfhydrase [Flavobacterium microcysteis]|uniref:1-aminocyclopropane-1-carboxylate deaminase/D-cysteine desulfhydrase n=1 Tax=Flavobacterium microcysteis TaxID=2596891 RepID=A0A501PZ95_9FLAO|nr:pyridoxal-phosphate dependent enzyme [Flavobacterium microcysteis]TPD65753.1 1-aminocyclopropane-1-carboxylate deaminase/D-cysteine desulfhydrase [Flavobacterium microcysteis]
MIEVKNQLILKKNTIDVFVKREDLIHPFVSGNKYRKLKYNLQKAKEDGYSVLLTFGGAFSNHIAAVAFAGKENNFKTIGIIRGDELREKIDENPTLKFAQENGMQFEFVSRAQYSDKENPKFESELKNKFGNFYLIPEGGTNELAVKGCEEILVPEDAQFDYICCAVGTGGTISGISNAALPHQKVLGFPALKGDFLKKEIRKFASNENWELIADYHFGGYGKVNLELIEFINNFYQDNNVPLDPVYTGKLVFGVLDLIEKNYFPNNSKILIIHTGGLQGIQGMNTVLENKQLPKIKINV